HGQGQAGPDDGRGDPGAPALEPAGRGARRAGGARAELERPARGGPDRAVGADREADGSPGQAAGGQGRAGLGVPARQAARLVRGRADRAPPPRASPPEEERDVEGEGEMRTWDFCTGDATASSGGSAGAMGPANAAGRAPGWSIWRRLARCWWSW